MTASMSHNGYTARIHYDDDDKIFFGQIAGITDNVGFHGETVHELRAAFEEAVEDYIDTCAKVGKEPQKPYSGRVMFRIDPETHRRAAIAAEIAGISLNVWAEGVLAAAAAKAD